MITKEELKYIAQLFSEYMLKEINNDPGYTVKDEGRLESSLAQPFQSIEGKELYPTLVDKAAMLYYLCIKNHPFEDGNKRMGIFSLLLYLYKNGYWLDTTNDELFDITVYTASSKVEDMQEVVEKIKVFVEEHLVTSS
ncbi:MAG TPA: type II toxin-antitoxin system death-on-curing family toxin [Candidatus Dojkabacteria bacterium]|nr:type II toxin-antitoxin system death-on-curing family toxin [Candidatus Dojkabacteria bacterium]HOR05980.1 type II toxin-antitoxin system death-on-curing family toxin [Candidatus Dojkabacteria bacterium]